MKLIWNEIENFNKVSGQSINDEKTQIITNLKSEEIQNNDMKKHIKQKIKILGIWYALHPYPIDHQWEN